MLHPMILLLSSALSQIAFSRFGVCSLLSMASFDLEMTTVVIQLKFVALSLIINISSTIVDTVFVLLYS